MSTHSSPTRGLFRLQKLAHICILLVLSNKYPLGLESEYLFIYIFQLPFIAEFEKTKHELEKLIPDEKALQQFIREHASEHVSSEEDGFSTSTIFKLKTPLVKGISISQDRVKTRDGNIKFFKHVLGSASLSAVEIASMMLSYPLQEATQKVASYFNKVKGNSSSEHTESLMTQSSDSIDTLRNDPSPMKLNEINDHYNHEEMTSAETNIESSFSNVREKVETWGNEDEASSCEFFSPPSMEEKKPPDQQQQVPNITKPQDASIFAKKQPRKRKDQPLSVTTINNAEKSREHKKNFNMAASSSIRMCQVINQIDDLLDIFPSTIKTKIQEICHDRMEQLVEIVMDKERPYEFYFYGNESEPLSDEGFMASGEDITQLCHKLHFASDDRAGIDGTLHRISRIENRKNQPIGLTIRVGRAVIGLGNVFKDLLESGKNILCVGFPGSGKTTVIRDIARILSERNRVMIVDTSCEIAGLGDVPHQAVGRSRRIPVKDKKKQKECMINAVQNHTPQVIVIDEIGTREEAATARTISQRGVRMIASAHGSLESMLMNPTLCDLLGGVETVTLGDSMAAFRNGQKVIMQTKGNPIFHTVIEFIEKKKDDYSWMSPDYITHKMKDQQRKESPRVEWRVYTDIKTTVQNILQGKEYTAQVRTLKNANDVNSVESRVLSFEPANVVFA